MSDKRIALLVGKSEDIDHIGPIVYDLINCFMVRKENNLDDASLFINSYDVSIVIIFAYRDDFINDLNQFKGDLPPTIYWLSLESHETPTKSGITCVSYNASPKEIMKIITDIAR